MVFKLGAECLKLPTATLGKAVVAERLSSEVYKFFSVFTIWRTEFQIAFQKKPNLICYCGRAEKLAAGRNDVLIVQASHKQ